MLENEEGALLRVKAWLVGVSRRASSGVWNTLRLSFTVALFIGGAYLVDTRINVYVGLLLVGWSFARASIYAQMAIRLSHFRFLLDAVSETRSAIRMEMYLKIDAILEHPACIAAFERLKGVGRVPAEVTLEKWRQALIERFRNRAKLPAEHKPWAHVVFEIRAGQLWVDGAYRCSSVIYHDVLIPDDSLKTEYALSNDENDKYHGLKVRAFVLNGLLTVQIGEWREEEGHREAGQEYSWMAWDTITTFPLLLNPLDHYLPPRFLLLDYFSLPLHRPDWAHAKRKFFQQAEEYRRALSTFGAHAENRLHERQAREFKRWLDAESFELISPTFPSWVNKFLVIHFAVANTASDTYNWLSAERR